MHDCSGDWGWGGGGVGVALVACIHHGSVVNMPFSTFSIGTCMQNESILVVCAVLVHVVMHTWACVHNHAIAHEVHRDWVYMEE